LTNFDYAAGFMLLVSGVVGFARGATREVATVVAFVLAAILSAAALRYSGPLAATVVHARWLASIAAILVVFIIAYLIFRMLGGALTRTVQQTSLSGLDRALGFGIGLARGLVVLGAFALLLDAAMPPERMPAWISNAQLYPLADASGGALRAFAPQGIKVAHDVAPDLADAVGGVEDPTSRDTPARAGHDSGKPREVTTGHRDRPADDSNVEDIR
jgi:membrane protein required for colicin V production